MKPPYVYSCEDFIPGKTRVQYSGPFWNDCEIDTATEALQNGRWITSGEYVARFQNEFGRMFRAKHCLMVNSGSSANLVMIAALKKCMGWKDGDEIIVSPVGFPTTIAPVVQNGLRPVFVDIEMNTLNFDLDLVARAITPRTRAIFVSPVLGNPPDMDRLREIAWRHSIRLIGDNCDSLGTTWGGRLWNECCLAWSSSFYAAHHLCTGEGGAVCSNNPEIIETARSIAWWGRDCRCVGAANLLPCGTCGKRFSDWLGDGEMDHRYVFTNVGYNLKPLDLQGAIGLEQLKKFPEIEAKRRANAAAIREALPVRTASWAPQADVVWFGVPLICESRKIKESLVQYLEANLIQTRPYFAGNILRHPGYKHLGCAADYPNANLALSHTFFIGCAPQYSPEVLGYIREVLCRPSLLSSLANLKKK